MTAFGLFFGSVSAAGSIELSISDDNQLVWINQDADVNERTFNADLECEGDYAEPEIRLYRDDKQVSNVSTGTISYSGFSQTGEYLASGSCEDPNNVTHFDNKTFHVGRLNPEITQPKFDQNAFRGYNLGDESKDPLYKGKPVEVDLELEGVPDGFELEKSDISFDVTLSGYGPLDKPGFVLEEDSGEYRAILNPFIPEDVDAGYYALEIDATYNSGSEDFFATTSTPDDALYVTGVKVAEKRPARPPSRDGLEEIGLDLTVEDGYAKYLEESKGGTSRFSLQIEPVGDYPKNEWPKEYTGDEVFELYEVNSENSRKYVLDLSNTPQGYPSEDDFRMKVLFNDPKKLSSNGKKIEIASYRVTEDVIFKGYVKDANGNPVNSQFKIFRDNRLSIVETQENGFYYRKLAPGNRTFEMSFSQGGEEKAKFSLSDVKLQKQFPSKVRFDYTSNPQNLDISAARPINRMATVFGVPFSKESNTVEMTFTSSSVNFQETSVYECRDWMFERDPPKCNPEYGWEKIPESEVTRISVPFEQKVVFPVTPKTVPYYNSTENILTSAYVIATTSGLRLNGEPQVQGTENSRIKSGGDIKFNGMVVAGESEQVGNADVEVTMLNNGQEITSFQATTSSDGTFSASGEVPKAPENYTVEVEASKQPYETFKTDLSGKIWVYRKEELSISPVDRQPEISLDGGRVPVELENTGQTNIENIQVSPSSQDLPPEFFNLSRSTVSGLSPGETEEIELIFDFPDDYSTNDYYPEIDIEVEADGEKGSLRISDTVNPVLSRSTTNTGTEKDDEQKNSSVKSTGSFFSAPSISSPSLSSVPGADATGEFLASQSTLNIALGLVMIFLMVLAGAMKSKKNGDRSGRNVITQQVNGAAQSPGARPNIQPPKVSPVSEGSEDEVDEDGSEDDTDEDSDESEKQGQVEKMAGRIGEEESGGSDSGETEVKCDICGEGFDTEAAVKMHKKTAH